MPVAAAPARTAHRLATNAAHVLQVLQQLDAEGCARVAAVLRGLPQASVLVVGQAHSFVTEAFDTVDVVVKRGGCSSVEAAP
jgi:hypothetical protein